ncbi:hypothetical protein M8J77_023372 [Diaphorina citri]|nr:hypothetical protein M8J77_023372 [Diaphorina citri]
MDFSVLITSSIHHYCEYAKCEFTVPITIEVFCDRILPSVRQAIYGDVVVAKNDKDQLDGKEEKRENPRRNWRRKKPDEDIDEKKDKASGTSAEA